MPYMAVCVGAALRNQLKLMGASEASTPDSADLICYVNCGNDDFRPSAKQAQELQQMLDKIDEQGQRLTKTPTYDELKSYRGLIKNFVGTVVSQMYSVNTQEGWDRMGRQKVYATVRKIGR